MADIEIATVFRVSPQAATQRGKGNESTRGVYAMRNAKAKHLRAAHAHSINQAINQAASTSCTHIVKMIQVNCESKTAFSISGPKWPLTSRFPHRKLAKHSKLFAAKN